MGSIKGVLLKFNSCSHDQEQLFLTIKLLVGNCSQDTPVEDLIRSQFQNEVDFSDQCSSHVKLLVALKRMLHQGLKIKSFNNFTKIKTQ